MCCEKEYDFDDTGGYNLDNFWTGKYVYMLYNDGSKECKNIVFQICAEDEHKVCVYEIGLRKTIYEGKKVNYVPDPFYPSRKPSIVPKTMNCWSKSKFWIRTNPDGTAIIPISEYKTGIAYLLKEESEKGIFNYYFEIYPNTGYVNKDKKIYKKNKKNKNYNIC